MNFYPSLIQEARRWLLSCPTKMFLSKKHITVNSEADNSYDNKVDRPNPTFPSFPVVLTLLIFPHLGVEKCSIEKIINIAATTTLYLAIPVT